MAIIRFQGPTSNSLIGMSIGFRCHDLGFENQNYLFIFGGSDRENICAHTAISFRKRSSSYIGKIVLHSTFQKKQSLKTKKLRIFFFVRNE